ncbi:MAG: T9SS type A sorting domain-containing protein [Bacteroidetes bacterium]|nr:T9SS type A sorting domain-containing protein [Bacteroidota bacterium]
MFKHLISVCILSMVLPFASAQTYTHSLRSNIYQHLNPSVRTYKDSSAVMDTILRTTFAIPYFGQALSDSIIIWGNGNFAFTEFEYDDEASVFGAELTPRKDGSSFIAQTTEGSSPNRIFKIEWGNMGFVYDTLGKDSMNYQVWFYEKDGIIEYHYGPSSVKNPSSWNGENGPYVYMVAYDGTNTYGLKGNPAAPLSYTSFITGAGPLNSAPDANAVFRFAPAAGNAVSDLKVAGAAISYKGPGLFELRTTAPLHAYTIYNLEGKKCLEGNTNQFSLSQLAAGMYLLHIKTANGVETVKLLNQ